MPLKKPAQIARMRTAGLLLWKAHQAAAALVREGTATIDIERRVVGVIEAGGGEALFKGVPGIVPYPAATCISINEQIVHGIPGDRTINGGDIVSIDIGVRLNGWCADAAVTYAVGEVTPENRALVDTTEAVLREAIADLATAEWWSEVARGMETRVRNAGFSVVEDLVGHAIGTEMWENPQVPNYVARDNGDFRIRRGMVLAIEPMIAAGNGAIRTLDDHWTIVTQDGTPAAHFEHTVAITDDGPVVLTCGGDGEGWGM